jgi:hypothetical protein
MDAADERHDEVDRALVYQRDARISPEEGARLRAAADADRLREQEKEWREIEQSGKLDRPGTFAAETAPPPYLWRRVSRSAARPVIRWFALSSPRCGTTRPRERRATARRASRAGPTRSEDPDPPLARRAA